MASLSSFSLVGVALLFTGRNGWKKRKGGGKRRYRIKRDGEGRRSINNGAWSVQRIRERNDEKTIEREMQENRWRSKRDEWNTRTSSETEKETRQRRWGEKGRPSTHYYYTSTTTTIRLYRACCVQEARHPFCCLSFSYRNYPLFLLYTLFGLFSSSHSLLSLSLPFNSSFSYPAFCGVRPYPHEKTLI